MYLFNRTSAFHVLELQLGQVLFPYEDLVMLFQCEECHISPKGLLNCGNRYELKNV